jgi:predicted ATPase
VWLAELAPLADPALVPAAIAAALGLEFPAGAVSAQHVANALNGKELLLVLDNCEHVIDAAARMAEALLRANPAVHVIATSREPLKAEGEWINPVPPLAAPAGAAQDQDDPLRYGAVRLFVERARAAARHFAPDRRLAALVAAICRRLDGIPLAIELAAATAADHFRQALDWARRCGALSWELRAATSLARLLRDQSRAADALALLQPVYDRFADGFDTSDLKTAKALIDSLPQRADARRDEVARFTHG